MALPQAKFAYNFVVNRSTGRGPFEVIYGRAPYHYLDIAPVADMSHKKAEDFTTSLVKIHEDVKRKLDESNDK